MPWLFEPLTYLFVMGAAIVGWPQAPGEVVGPGPIAAAAIAPVQHGATQFTLEAQLEAVAVVSLLEARAIRLPRYAGLGRAHVHEWCRWCRCNGWCGQSKARTTAAASIAGTHQLLQLTHEQGEH